MSRVLFFSADFKFQGEKKKLNKNKVNLYSFIVEYQDELFKDRIIPLDIDLKMCSLRVKIKYLSLRINILKLKCL